MALARVQTGAELRAWRAEVPVTQRQLARELGLGESTLREYEGKTALPALLGWALLGIGRDLRKRARRSIRERAKRARAADIERKRASRRRKRRERDIARKSAQRTAARRAERERRAKLKAIEAERRALTLEVFERGGEPTGTEAARLRELTTDWVEAGGARV